jgi:hypothetical protein
VHPISEAFGSLIGRPGWLTRRGQGSFVTIEFGQPVLDIGEPCLAPVFTGGAQSRSMQRPVFICGQ